MPLSPSARSRTSLAAIIAATLVALACGETTPRTQGAGVKPTGVTSGDSGGAGISNGAVAQVDTPPPVTPPDTGARARADTDTTGRRAADTTRRADTTHAARTARAGHAADSAAAERRCTVLSVHDSSYAAQLVQDSLLPGSLLPANRIVAYYGNPFSKRMGILGEIPPDQMLQRLAATADMYRKADPSRPVLPALELIAIVAQGSPGPSGLYRLRMPDSLIERVASWAAEKNYLLILDIQPGLSTVQAEMKSLMPYLQRPNVELALDPEFAMRKSGKVPGSKIGTMDASEINAAIRTLAQIVDQYHLPPKILIVHRFTGPMVTNSDDIRPDPRVQVVMDMDGFGPQWLKKNSYRAYIRKHPVQFTGFKLFYKNDKPLFTPDQVVDLCPRPLFVMYQ